MSQLICLFAAALVSSGVYCNVEFSTQNLRLLTNESTEIQLILRNTERQPVVNLFVQHPGILELQPNGTWTAEENVQTQNVFVKALKAGETIVYTNDSSHDRQFMKVVVYNHHFVEILSLIMGWAYFLAWSISFYPQIWENYKRQSVIGLNFDFMVINLTGYVTYALFNLGLYYIPLMREQYSERYPFSIVSVLPNDIFFSVHALIVTIYTGLQCFWYERGDQRISWFGWWFHYISGLVIVGTVILCLLDYVEWLDFLYVNSYIKLSVTICKYVPQAYMNYQRKSTEGWSIVMVLLDVAGGIFCTVQMFLNAYNYDKWEWILENPTKLWLGILSIIFDLIFILQHYCLYNNGGKKKRQNKIDLRMEAPLKKEILSV